MGLEAIRGKEKGMLADERRERGERCCIERDGVGYGDETEWGDG